MWKLDGSKKPLNKSRERKMSKKQKQNDLIQKTNLYVVKKGDTLYSISRKHNISVQELKNLNNIKDSNISVGQSIKIIN